MKNKISIIQCYLNVNIIYTLCVDRNRNKYQYTVNELIDEPKTYTVPLDY